MYILAIESTCDDSCISILENGKVILDERISSEKILAIYGGIVPEIAARNHGENLIKVLSTITSEIPFNLDQLDYIAYSSEPGLPGSLHSGKILAKTIAWYLEKELVPINHIYAHCFSAFVNQGKVTYPFISVIASGGTSSIFLIKSSIDVIELNKKKDDALGEAFDKIGKMLGLEYPGGISIDKIYDEEKVEKIFKNQPVDADFSFSGSKSKVLNLINMAKRKNEIIDVVKIASSFQFWAIEILLNKIEYYYKKHNTKIVTIGGGVANNSLWRKRIKELDFNVISPEKKYCSDNASMIGFLCYLMVLENK